MNTIGRIPTWTCVCCILFSGCYSYTTTHATETGDSAIDPASIYAILAKDGTQYEFDHAPIIENDKIVGMVGGRSVLIPMSDVQMYYSRRPDTLRTLGLLAGMGLVIAFYASFSHDWL